jgi:hypothetical protein
MQAIKGWLGVRFLTFGEGTPDMGRFPYLFHCVRDPQIWPVSEAGLIARVVFEGDASHIILREVSAIQ